MNAWVDSAVAFSAANAWFLMLLAFAASACEALVVVGTVVPGTAILLAVAALAGVGNDLSLAGALVAAAILGAIGGDGSSYWLGRRYGPGLLEVWPLSRRPEWRERGEAFFRQHGGKSVFLGRFVPGVKTIVPALAGMNSMPVGQFLLANVTSAILWGLGFVFAGLGVGRGIDRYGLADPRLVVLLTLLVASLGVAYFVLRFLVVRGMPALASAHLRLVERLRHRRGRAAALVLRVLANDGGAAVAISWAAIGAFALVGFLIVVGQVVFDAHFSQADAIISNAVQSLRFEPFDVLMIAVTMAGDGVVLAALALSALIWVLACRRWRAAGAAAVAFTLTALFVPAFKALLGRERPNLLYEGADAFSFPSGHATQTLVVFGVITILLAHDLPIRSRLAAYFAALGIALLVAFSRVYLGAHWPSDVAGGLLFGSVVIAAFAFVLRGDALPIRPAWMAAALLLVFGLSYGLHVERAYARWTAKYTYAPRVVAMTPAEWLSGGWERLPKQRITLDRAKAQPFIAQFAGELTPLLEGLQRGGWALTDTSLTQSVLSALLPYGPFGAVRPTIVLHDGRLPLATLVKPAAEARQRLVMRVWPSQVVIREDDPRQRPVYLLDLSAETYDPLPLGFGDLDQAPIGASETTTVTQQMGSAFATTGPVTSDTSGRAPLLITNSGTADR